jgi:dTDP-4-dehydrorhamnose reductase
LVTGGNGQLGQELKRTCPPEHEIITVDICDFDLCSSTALQACLESTNPEIIINCAAYTAVDKAEQEKDIAFKANTEGAYNLALAAQKCNAKLIQISTDFIFSGKKSSPYLPDDQATPISVYGESKLKGEKKVLSVLKDNALIIRTAWLYSAFGNNFVKTMLRLMQERDSLSVVADQIGTPAWGKGLALAIWRSIDKELTGIHHWTDAGVASWYDFAVAIQEEALGIDLLKNQIAILPIRTLDYPTPAQRPSYSVLDKTKTWDALGYIADHWRVSLREMLKELRTEC